MKVSNQKKKELFELLIEYYQLKPEDKWCTEVYLNDDRCCAAGFMSKDFGGIHLHSVANIVCQLTVSIKDMANELVRSNDGVLYAHIPTPKQRVLQYLKDEISKL